MMKDGYLCVGGPYDGKFFASSRPSSFSIPVLTETSTAGPDAAETRADDESQKAPAHKVVEYHLEEFHTPQGVVKMWTPADQTPMQTMILLLESYAQGAKYWRNMDGIMAQTPEAGARNFLTSHPHRLAGGPVR